MNFLRSSISRENPSSRHLWFGRIFRLARAACLLAVSVLGFATVRAQRGLDAQPLTVVALGDAGKHGASLRSCASLLENMRTGQHDGGRCNLLLFLGDNFGDTGLNVAGSDVESEAQSTLGLFRPTLNDLSRSRVHGIPGESEYFARRAVEKTALFGLITMSEWPVGVSDKGVRRSSALPEWTFHAGVPSIATYPASDGTMDSVQFVFFDSALLLRTTTATWSPVLNHLRALLVESARHPGVAWRILVTHHPFVTLGEHGGYTVWNDEDSSVDYATGCDRDSNAFRFVQNWIDPEDLCTERYVAYVDSVSSILAVSGLQFQIQLSSHDQSMQLLRREHRHGAPPLIIVSGASSEGGRVALSSPPESFTAGRRSDAGISLKGFAQLRWKKGEVEATFFNAKNGDRIDMGGGIESFLIDRDGTVRPLSE